MSAPNRGGRPPKPEDEKAEAVMYIRCRTEDKARWTNKARAEGKKLSQWVKERLD